MQPSEPEESEYQRQQDFQNEALQNMVELLNSGKIGKPQFQIMHEHIICQAIWRTSDTASQAIMRLWNRGARGEELKAPTWWIKDEAKKHRGTVH